MKTVSLDEIAALLPPPKGGSEPEAFELRWLVSEGELEERIRLEVGDKMCRFTFPSGKHNGRARVWLKRPNGYLRVHDVEVLLELSKKIAKMGDLKIIVNAHTQANIRNFCCSEFLELDYVILEPRPKHSRRRRKAPDVVPEEYKYMSLEDYLRRVFYNPYEP